MTEKEPISFLVRNYISLLMSARTAMRTMRSFSQSVRLSKRCMFAYFVREWFCRNTLRAFDATPQMKLRPSLRMNQMEYLNKKMCNAFAFSKVNKAEVILAELCYWIAPTNASCCHDSNGIFFLCSHFEPCWDFVCYSFQQWGGGEYKLVRIVQDFDR